MVQLIKYIDYELNYENPSPQLYKLEISYIVDELTAPVKEFGGIFKSTAIDIETGIQYYNFLETNNYNEILHQNIFKSHTRLVKKRISIKVDPNFLLLMNDANKKLLLNRLLLRKIS